MKTNSLKPSHWKTGFFRRFVRFMEPFLSDELYLQLLFRQRVGYKLNLHNPSTFCEKIQCLKLESKKHPEYTKLVDKAAVKDYVASIIGEKYVIPTFGIWDSVDDIDWSSLPNKFVIKSTSDSGGVIICKDKSKLDIKEAVRKLTARGTVDYTRYNKEFPYRNVPHRFIAEKLLDNGRDKDLPDYKFFCFNGEPKYCQVIRDRHSKETIDFYDMNWEHQEFVGLNPVARNGKDLVERPERLDDMIEVCRKLANKQPFVRVDLYVVEDKVYFGEITLFPASGMGVFTPDRFDKILGDMIALPGINGGG